MKRVCVFSGSSPGGRPDYLSAAAELGRELAARGVGLVYGGAKVGLMGVVADAVIAEGGEAIGVIPERLMKKEIAHDGLTDLRVVASMHERKATMADLADGIIALPGGFGTLEEFIEAVTWVQLGLQVKPCGLLDVAGYYQPLLRLVEHAIQEQFIPTEHGNLIIVEQTAARLLDAMPHWQAPAVEKWVDRPPPAR